VIPIPAFDRPFLILSGGDQDAYMQQFRNSYTNLFARLTHDAYYAHLTNSTHLDFNETPCSIRLLPRPTFAARKFRTSTSSPSSESIYGERRIISSTAPQPRGPRWMCS